MGVPTYLWPVATPVRQVTDWRTQRLGSLFYIRVMRVLIVGGGGREHALAWRLKRENPAVEILAAPGNPGIAELGECISLQATDVQSLLELARDREVDFTVVGPEGPLEAGIVDRFRAAGLPIFGPSQG